MSGRTRVKLADGRVVRGYRKTLRQQKPRDGEEPTLGLMFRLPPALALLAPGQYHGSRINVTDDATAVTMLTTWHREKLFKLVADFVHEVTRPDTVPWSVTMTLTSSAEPNWADRMWRLTWIGGYVVIDKSAVTPLIYPPA